MSQDHKLTMFISPKSRKPLIKQSDVLFTTHDQQESFKAENRIIQLFHPDASNSALIEEMNVFDNIPVQGISYFLPSVYLQMLEKLSAQLPLNQFKGRPVFRFAELGGGEGHCARHVANYVDRSEVYVCDLSREVLKRAPEQLNKVWADITKPVFAPETLDAAAFWVSLHHLNEEEQKLALLEAFRALKAGGVLILFEPNESFLLRKILYKSPLRHDVYFDKNERAIDFTAITTLAGQIGFKELETMYLNPPYNPAYLQKLKRWMVYLPVVEMLYLESVIINRWQSLKHTSKLRFTSLYGMSFLSKPVHQ